MPMYEATEAPPNLPPEKGARAGASPSHPIAMAESPLPSAPPPLQEAKALEIEAWRRAQAEAGNLRMEELGGRDESDRSDRSSLSRTRRDAGQFRRREGMTAADTGRSPRPGAKT